MWDADSDCAEIQRKVAALRAQLAPLEQDLAERNRMLRAARSAHEEATDRLVGYEHFARKPV